MRYNLFTIFFLLCGFVFGQGTEGLSYREINNGTALEVSIGSPTSRDIIIPPVYDGLPVTRIANRGFAYCAWINGIRSIELPNSITEIGDGAFIAAYLPSPFILPEGLVYVGEYAFGHSFLSFTHLPETIVYIGETAFYSAGPMEFPIDRYFRSIHIPAGTTFIGDHAFVSRGTESITVDQIMHFLEMMETGLFVIQTILL